MDCQQRDRVLREIGTEGSQSGRDRRKILIFRQKHLCSATCENFDKPGHPIPRHPELPVEKAAEIKILSKKDPVPLVLQVRLNLVQQKLTRMNMNSFSLLDKSVEVPAEVMRMVVGILEVTRDNPEWAVLITLL